MRCNRIHYLWAALLVIIALAPIALAQTPSQSSGAGATRAVKPVTENAEKRESLPSPDRSEQNAQPDLRIGSGDLLEIKVYGAPELSDNLRVSSGGEITVPLIGVVKIGGLTAEQAQHLISERFRSGGYLRDPHVNILIKEFATQGISVLGEVARPGIYPLLGSRRLFDAISAAGGTTSRAGKMAIITHRDSPTAPHIVTISRDPTMVLDQNVSLQPGDTLMVTKAGIVYVSGDVKVPGGYLMDNNENLTVLQALALAQGLNPTASSKNARIIRRAGGKLQDVPVPLRQIMEAKAPDISLESEDVLFIPNSASKSAARRSLESIVQVATGLAIYRR